MKFDTVTLRCDDGAEAVVFKKFSFTYANNVEYEISVEDDYIGGDYKGFFGRVKRAWRAFTDKPVVYTGIYCEDKDKMRKFLGDCLDLVEDNNNIDEKPFLKGLYSEDDSVATYEELIKKGE
jgi:hypothetical protein